MAQSSVIGLLRVLLSANTAEFDSAMERAAGSAKALTKDLKTFGTHATNVGASLTKAFTVPLAGLGLAVTKLAIDFEDSFAGVRKTVDASEAEFDQMAQSFRDLSKTIPVNVNELNRLGEAAGALGIPKEEIVDFSRVMAELGVTTNLTSDQAADAIARIQNIFGAAGKDTERLASTIVALGNAGASTEKEITEMAQRIAGAGHTVGLTQAQVVSFASTLASVGINAEAGGSAISRIFLKMNDAVAKGGKGLTEFARVAGMSVSKFKQLFEQDAAGATSKFIEGLGRLKGAGENINGTIEGLIGKNIILKDTLFRLSGAGQLLNEQLKIGDKAWQDNTALTIEAGKRFETTSSQMTLLWNRIKDVGITLGNALLPLIRSTVGALDGLLPVLEKIGRGFANLPGPLQALIVGIGVAVAAAGPLIFIFGQLALSASALTAAFGVAGAGGAVGVFGTALAALANPITLTIGALGLVSLAIYGVVTAETDLEKSARENTKAFKVQTDQLEGSLATYDRLKDKTHLTAKEHQDLDKATRALADASGLSVDAFNREAGASKDLTGELHKQLEKRQELYEAQVRQVRTGAVEAIQALGKARAELQKMLAGETQKVEVAGVPGKVDPQTRAFTGPERAKEVERLKTEIAALEKQARSAEQAFSKLTGGVSTDSMTWTEWGVATAAATGKAAKGLKAAGDATEDVGKKGKKAKTEIEKLATELERMRADLSGASAIAEAHKMLDALKGLPPVQTLTREAQQKINETMGRAMDVYRGFGLTAPAEIGKVYSATLHLADGLKVTDGITKLSIGGFNTWADTWARGLPIVNGLGAGIDQIGIKITEFTALAGTFGKMLKDSLFKDLQAIPQMLVQAFTGGGDFLGALKGIASMVGSTLGKGIGFALGGPLGEAIGGALGSLAGQLVTLLKGLFGPSKEQLAGRSLIGQFHEELVATLTDAQRLEAGNVAWKQDTIAIRDAYLATGLSIEQAQAATEALWASAEGGSATAKAQIEAIRAVMAKVPKSAAEAAEASAAAQAKALETIAAKYAETLSQIDSERKSLIDRIAGEAPEEFMGLQEIADRARLAELDAQKAAIEEKQAAEEDAAKESFAAAKANAQTTLDEVQVIFDQGVEIPVRYKLPGSAPIPIQEPVEGFARGTGGFRDFGTGTPAILHGVEAVVRPGETMGGGGTTVVNVSVDQSGSYFDSEATADAMTRKMFDRIRNGGGTLSEFQNLVALTGRGRIVVGAFRFAHQLLRGGAVSGTAPDDTYLLAWLVDGVPGTPYQKTGNVALSVTPPASASMDVFALVNHTVNVAAALSGAVSGSIPAGALDEEGIRVNPFLLLDTPVTVSTAINLGITSNSGPVIVGEFVGGLSTALEAYQLDFDPGEPFPWEGEFSSIAPYDPGLSHPRRLSGEVVLDDAGFAQVQAWYRATKRGSRPSLIIPDDDVQDAWLGVFSYREHYSETLHFVTLEIAELPRTRW